MPETTRRDVLRAAGLTMAGTTLAGCLGIGGGGSDTIKLGAVYPQSGAYALLGSQNVQAHELAVDEINENGGINDTDVELLTRDSQLDPGAATTATQELIESDGADVISGAVSSGVTSALKEPAKRNNVVVMNSTSAARSLTGADCSKIFFRFRLHIEQQAVAFAPWLAENIGDTMYITYADYAWGQSGREWFTRLFEEAGGTVVGSVGIPLGSGDMSQYLSKVDESADILLGVHSGADGATWINQSAQFGLDENMTRAGVDILAGNMEATEGSRTDLKTIAEYPEGVFGPWATEANRTFREKFQTRFDEEPIYHAGMAYSMVKAWAKAARDSGFTSSEDTDSLVTSLEELSLDGAQLPVGSGHMRASDHNIALQQGIADVTDEYELLENVSPTVADSITSESCSL